MNAQAIRKNFLEMTDSEKTDLVDAFYQLRDMDYDGITTLSDPNPDDDDPDNPNPNPVPDEDEETSSKKWRYIH
jgi:tyrosinase